MSGVNGGPNAGDSWIASGTIGAARMAAYFGIPALAVSGVDTSDPAAMQGVADWVVRIARSPLVRALEPGDYLVVNLPVGPVDEINGVVLVPPDRGITHIGFIRTEAEDTWALQLERSREPAPEADWAALAMGKIAITPMRIGETLPLDPWRSLVAELPLPIETTGGN